MPDDLSDLHFSDRLACVAHDLREVSLWLEARRDEYDASGLMAPYVEPRVRVWCRNRAELDAATEFLGPPGAPGAEAVVVDDDGEYVRVSRTFGTVVLQAWAKRADVEIPRAA